MLYLSIIVLRWYIWQVSLQKNVTRARAAGTVSRVTTCDAHILGAVLAVPFLIQLPDDAPECVSKGMPPVFGSLQLKGGISDVPSTWLFLI